MERMLSSPMPNMYVTWLKERSGVDPTCEINETMNAYIAISKVTTLPSMLGHRVCKGHCKVLLRETSLEGRSRCNDAGVVPRCNMSQPQLASRRQLEEEEELYTWNEKGRTPCRFERDLPPSLESKVDIFHGGREVDGACTKEATSTCQLHAYI